jgi:hypothetical protein
MGNGAAAEKTSLPDKSVTPTLNPHFTGKYCDECHEGTPVEGGDKLLKFGGDYTQLCSCHNYTPGTYIHPVEIVPSMEKMEKMADTFPLENGKISCGTCHDIYEQCKNNPKLMINKSKFFRGGPYLNRTTMCFKCHDENKYKMLDPHNQLDNEWKIIPEKCLYCHVTVPDREESTFEDVQLIGDLKVLCQRCHGSLLKHPGNAFHYLIPSDKFMRRIKEMEREYQVILPLDYEGKLTCTTCHNPHERGVIPGMRKSAKGASDAFRHRIPKKLCTKCHGL